MNEDSFSNAGEHFQSLVARSHDPITVTGGDNLGETNANVDSNNGQSGSNCCAKRGDSMTWAAFSDERSRDDFLRLALCESDQFDTISSLITHLQYKISVEDEDAFWIMNWSEYVLSLELFTGFSNLRVLELDQKVQVQNLAPLENFVNLKQLSLTVAVDPHNEDNLEPLSRMLSLENLKIGALSHELSLRHLANIRNLKSLEFYRTLTFNCL